MNKDIAGRRPRVGLFVTCLVDLFRPTVGFAAVKLLEEAGCTVEVPRRRPAAASRPTIPATAPTRAAIAAAGDRGLRGLRLRRGAVRLLRRHAQGALSRAVRRRPGMGARAPRRSPRKTYELVVVPGRRAAASTAVDGALRRHRRPITIPARACASSASRRSRAGCSPASRASSSSRCTDAEVCCGFGGTFCVKYPEISNAIVEQEGRATSRRPAPARCWPAISAA